MSIINEISEIVGKENVISGADSSDYLVDQRKKLFGKALAVVKPGNTQEVAKVVKASIKHQVAVIPQGGNSGLMGGATPDNSGNSIVLSLERLNKILGIDIENNTIIVEAGAILQDVQNVVKSNDRLFPLSFGAEKQSQIGGNLSTNAGGTRVLHYGNAKDLTLGIEVVTAEGEVWNGLRALRKDNSGYNLRDIYIGSEGTLGIITAAVLKLFPQPKAQITAFVAFKSVKKAVTFLGHARGKFGPGLTAYELISADSLELVKKYRPDYVQPFDDETLDAAWYALIELSDFQGKEHGNKLFFDLIEEGTSENLIEAAVIAHDQHQIDAFWALRNNGIGDAQLKFNHFIVKHDVSVPTSKFPEFINASLKEIKEVYPEAYPVIFGHLGDGNLHYNISLPFSGTAQAFQSEHTKVVKIIHDNVITFNGSVCAEHGVGQVKVDQLLTYKSDIELDLFYRLKNVFDPKGLLNPGKVIPQVNKFNADNRQGLAS